MDICTKKYFLSSTVKQSETRQTIFLSPMFLLSPLLSFSHLILLLILLILLLSSYILEPSATLQSWFRSCQFSKGKKHEASWIQLLITGWVVRICEILQMMKEKIIPKIQVEAGMFQVNFLYLNNRNPYIKTKASWDTSNSTFLFPLG